MQPLPLILEPGRIEHTPARRRSRVLIAIRSSTR